MKLCSKCKVAEARAGQRYCRSCHARSMRQVRRTEARLLPAVLGMLVKEVVKR